MGLHGSGHFAPAERLYRELLAAAPDHLDALHMLGILLIQTGRADAGFALIDRALALRPDFVDAHFNRGLAMLQLGRAAEALASFDKALAIRADLIDARYNSALALMQLNRPAEALDRLDRVLAGQPDHAEAMVNRGILLAGLKRTNEALAAFARVLAAQPDNRAAHFNRGVALSELKRFEESLASIDTAIRMGPDDPQAHFNRGGALKGLGRIEEALASFDRALALAPNYPDALVNRGVTLKLLGRPQEALASYQRALAIQPDNAEAMISRGAALDELGRLDEALASYDAALAVNPTSALARFNKSLILLVTGRFAEAWPLYESREALARSRSDTLAQPAWDGRGSLAGKSLFVHWEQGLGDTLHFCRYASVAADAGAEVTLSVQDRLLPLFEGFDERIAVIGADRTPAAFDLHAALLSLPGAFGTTLDSIPAGGAYLKANRDLADAWIARLGPRRRPRIGLVWSGAADYENDRNRSIPLPTIASLLSQDADWICLQRDIRDSDRKALAAHPQLQVFAPELMGFAETAALIDALDLVISVDTSLGHLAAALGRPTWLLLSFSPEWRWMLDRDDSPWHPTVTLFRQPTLGGWEAAIALVRQALAARFP